MNVGYFHVSKDAFALKRKTSNVTKASNFLFYDMKMSGVKRH